MVPAQGYIALGQGMEAQLPLTCYYRGKAPFEPERVVSAWLESRDGRQMGAAGIRSAGARPGGASPVWS